MVSVINSLGVRRAGRTLAAAEQTPARASLENFALAPIIVKVIKLRTVAACVDVFGGSVMTDPCLRIARAGQP